MLQSGGKYISKEYLRGFPAARTAASSGKVDLGPAMRPAEVMPRRDRSLTSDKEPKPHEN